MTQFERLHDMNFGPYAFAPDLPETWQTISSINPQLIFADMASKNEPIEDANSDTSDESDTPLAWKARLMTSTGLKAEMEKTNPMIDGKPPPRTSVKTIPWHHVTPSLSSLPSDSGGEDETSDYTPEVAPAPSNRSASNGERKKPVKKTPYRRDGPRRRSQNVSSQQKYRNKIKALRSLSDDFIVAVRGLVKLDPPSFRKRVLEELARVEADRMGISTNGCKG